MNITDEEQLKNWMSKNLLDRNEASKITGQSLKGFNQSVATKQIQPFFETFVESRATNRLYLKADMEKYALKKRSINK